MRRIRKDNIRTGDGHFVAYADGIVIIIKTRMVMNGVV